MVCSHKVKCLCITSEEALMWEIVCMAMTYIKCTLLQYVQVELRLRKQLIKEKWIFSQEKEDFSQPYDCW